jgi:RNA polymerase sigma factor (sigma-70 family)
MADPPLHSGSPPGEPLQDLALAALAGEEAAFECLHRRLQGGLQRFLLRRAGGSVDLAEELAQQAWVEVWRAFQEQRYDPARSAITTYVYAVGYKIWLQHCRRVRIAPRTTETPGQSSDPTATLHLSEMLDAVRDCLRATSTPYSLTREERQFIEGIATGETDRSMADKLGIAASTANARKNAAFAKLRRCLAAKGFPVERKPPK